MKLTGVVLGIACLHFALLPAGAQALDSDLDWPFPEFTKQGSMKIKAELNGAYLKVAVEHTRKYAMAVIPLEEVGGTLADVEAATTAGSGPKQFSVNRTTDSRVYLTRGTEWAAWYSVDIQTFPAEAVAELDTENKRLLVFYKIDLRGSASTPKMWEILLGEAMRWALAAEGQ